MPVVLVGESRPLELRGVDIDTRQRVARNIAKQNANEGPGIRGAWGINLPGN
jgi:hypothetical protein